MSNYFLTGDGYMEKKVIGFHLSSDSDSIATYLAEHPEALVPEPTPPEPTPEQKAAAIRAQRNALLAQSDWTQLPDSPVQAEAGWYTYRQALRDITEQAGFPNSVEWPVKPM